MASHKKLTLVQMAALAKKAAKSKPKSVSASVAIKNVKGQKFIEKVKKKVSGKKPSVSKPRPKTLPLPVKKHKSIMPDFKDR